ncbi:DUF6630 family protein [Duganella alba]|nr:PoNe immunity protein domain-containing protein [Duganella alba]
MKMRDPAGHPQRYEFHLGRDVESETNWEQILAALPPYNQAYRTASRYVGDQEHVHLMYGIGASLDEIIATLQLRTPRMLADMAYVRAYEGGEWSDASPLDGKHRRTFAYITLAMLLLPEPELMEMIRQMTSSYKDCQSYLYDLMLLAVNPRHKVQKKYKSDKYQKIWLDPVVRVLALPPQQRPAAMAKHMQQWTRIMRPFGWKPNLKDMPDSDRWFRHFAFEVALACALYDIDDSAFNTHPYYPRDLVDYYRAHIRSTRDGWRGEYVGAGVEVIAPPPPVKADLANSKRKNLARWVELAADGDIGATDSVLEITGKLRKVRDPEELLSALFDNDIAVHADIKDDDSLESQISSLNEARGLPPFEGPLAPPQGPARCEAMLHTWEEESPARGYSVVQIDLQDDAWHAVLVRSIYRDELLELSEALEIPLLVSLKT